MKRGIILLIMFILVLTTMFSGCLKPEININNLELDIHRLINQERQNYGYPSLEYDYDLSNIARFHSIEMANNNYFSHINLYGQDPTDRAKAYGYNCYKDFGGYYTDGIAENIFQNNLYDSVTTIYFIPLTDWNDQNDLAVSTVEGWMNSWGHRDNILNFDYEREGIGVAISYDDKVYITQNFW